mgnify:CR=1 FL=1
MLRKNFRFVAGTLLIAPVLAFAQSTTSAPVAYINAASRHSRIGGDRKNADMNRLHYRAAALRESAECGARRPYFDLAAFFAGAGAA